MNPKKIIMWILMLGYLYTLTFDIFLNLNFRIPTPLLFGAPMLVLFGKFKRVDFLYAKEFLIIFLALFLYYYLGQDNIKDFLVNLVVLVFCGLYFNYFVGSDEQRLNQSVFIFIVLLMVSSAVMILNHNDPSADVLRSRLIGGPVTQSPAGIALSIFSFGYQLAALTGFIFIYALKHKWNRLLQIIVFGLCLFLIYLGLQRSVLFTFVVSVVMFMVFYYKSKAVFIFGLLAFALFIGSNFINFESAKNSKYDNILAKNERKGEDRSGFVAENLRIYATYPYGLIFYGKKWSDVTRSSIYFSSGLTSHNAYLMFFTYLGPFVGIGLLIMLYKTVFKAFREAVSNIRNENYSMLNSLVFAFIAVSLNSLFHNAWLINSNGPTVFLYFALLQVYKVQQESQVAELQEPIIPSIRRRKNLSYHY